MRIVCLLSVAGFLAFSSMPAQAQLPFFSLVQRPKKPEPTRTVIYKTIGDVKLTMDLFEPEGHTPQNNRPAIVFFFGGGWAKGSPSQFHAQAKYLASRGMFAGCADYRVSSRHNTRGDKCVTDAKSAVRWLRKNADQLGIDPKRIAAGGGSAGGHIAACTALINGYDEQGESEEISSRPDALVLFNPAVVLASVGGEVPFPEKVKTMLDARLGTEGKNLSPYHHVKKGLPPTIIFHGKNDFVVPYLTVEMFSTAMRKAGNHCELNGFDGQGHGFFNYGRGDGSAYNKTVATMDTFLTDLEFLPERKKSAE